MGLGLTVKLIILNTSLQFHILKTILTLHLLDIYMFETGKTCIAKNTTCNEIMIYILCCLIGVYSACVHLNRGWHCLHDLTTYSDLSHLTMQEAID